MACLWCAKCRRARVHVNGCHKRPKDHRCTGADQLVIGHACQYLSQNLGQCARNRHRRHGPTHDKGRYDAGLIFRGKDFHRAHHHIIKRHRRVDVDQRCHDRIVFYKILTKQDFTHLNTVLCAAGFGHRSHKRFVRQFHMRQQHIQVTLVHRHICGFAHGAT